MDSILLFSDLHADIGALDNILELAHGDEFSRRYGPIKKFINMGDVMERGHSPEEVIDRLSGIEGLESILGNHDEAFLLRREVSGSDIESELAHEKFRGSEKLEDFFSGMGRYYIDREARLYAVHGGPLEPFTIVPPGSEGINAWLYSQTWQRISDIDVPYVDSSGYHYLPVDAFDTVKVAFRSTGYVIVCGHEHLEAAYRQKGGTIDDIYGKLERSTFLSNGRLIEERKLIIEEDSNYLVRLGLAGPEGYGGYGPGRCHFGVMYEDLGKRALCLLSFRPSRA